jgi:hypothetical protein
MPLSNVGIRRLEWFAIVASFALRAFGRVFGFARLPIALPAGAVLIVALRKHRARHPDSGPYSGRK